MIRTSWFPFRLSTSCNWLTDISLSCLICLIYIPPLDSSVNTGARSDPGGGRKSLTKFSITHNDNNSDCGYFSLYNFDIFFKNHFYLLEIISLVSGEFCCDRGKFCGISDDAAAHTPNRSKFLGPELAHQHRSCTHDKQINKFFSKAQLPSLHLTAASAIANKLPLTSHFQAQASR